MIQFNKSNPTWIIGPCMLENYDLCMQVADKLLTLDLSIIFKGSFDKANRTSGNSVRGPGLEEGLSILERIKKNTGLSVITDIHIPQQAKALSEVVDMIQIPAFLCRQTDLIHAASNFEKPLLIKKGQFMSPYDMKFAVEKSNTDVVLCERGTMFGYNDLIVDFRSLAIMEEFSPVVYDATHSVQKPGGNNGSSGGNLKFAARLAKAAYNFGISGIFLETHPDPSNALSDKETQIPLNELYNFIEYVVK